MTVLAGPILWHVFIQWLTYKNKLVKFMDDANALTGRGATDKVLVNALASKFITLSVNPSTSNNHMLRSEVQEWQQLSIEWRQFIYANQTRLNNSNLLYKKTENDDEINNS